ncbi:MAG: type II toxin-antitoxin system VapC family toxin [Acidobacteria bacterium]|nr:type II toxin-antitoxin system VapC family toxin [Acidobacteriota bacterium]
MSLRLLDTNIWIALAKGDSSAIAALRALPHSQIVCCSIVRAELLYGARKSQRVAANLHWLDELVGHYLSLPFDDSAAAYYGSIRTLLERDGLPIGGNDLMIAAIALAHDCTLVTRNVREFRRVPGLRLELWANKSA